MDAKLQAVHEARISKALALLGSRRREKLDKLDIEAFVDGLKEFKADVIEHVCDELGRIAPEDYQPRFPLLSTIRELCHRRIELERERRLALRAAPLEATYGPPLSPEKMAEIRREVEAGVRRHRMGGGR